MASRRVIGIGAMALLLWGCSGGDDGGVLDAGDTSTTVEESTERTTTTAAADEVATRDADVDLPRSFTYGHVTFELTTVELSNATPGTYLDDEQEPGAEELLYVAFTAAFDPEFSGVTDQWDVDYFELVTADDDTIVAEGVDFGSSITVNGRTETESAVVFEADEDDLDGATLRLTDGRHLPAEIPLTGTVPASPYPIAAPVTGQAAVTYDGGCADAQGSVEVLGAEWDVDGGIDAKGLSILGSGTKRTVETERFVRIRARAVAASGTCGGTIVTGDHFRLIADGLPLESENVSRSELLANGEGVEFIWGFRVPLTAQQLELEVGTTGGTTARIAIPKPTLP